MKRSQMLIVVCAIGVLLVSVFFLSTRHSGSRPLFNRGMDGDTAKSFSPEDQKKIDEFTELVRSKWGSSDSDIPESFFEAYYGRFGGAVMAAALDRTTQCHNRGHNLGRVIFAQTNDLALASLTCNSSCSEGCIHGVIMAYVADTDQTELQGTHIHAADLSPELKKKLSNVCTSLTRSFVISEGDCYHAIGHALAALGDDEPAAIALCDIFADKGVGAQYYCGTGF